MSADEIRAKRLAKLAAMGSARPASPQSSSGQPDSSPKANPEPKKIKTEPPPQPPAAPKQPAQKPAVKTTPSAESVLSPEEQVSRWLGVQFKDIFQVTLKPAEATQRVVYLESLAAEITTENRLLGESDVESVFMEVLSSQGIPTSFSSSFEYLFHIYSKCFQLKRTLPKKAPAYDAKLAITNSIINYACSYGLICFQIGDMFINNDVGNAIKLLIRSQSTMSPFLVDIVHKAVEQDSLLELLNIVLPFVSSQIQQFNLHDSSYTNYLAVYETLVDLKPVAAIFSQVDGFEPPNPDDGLDFETKTLLGPVLQLSPFFPKAATYYFGQNLSVMSQVQISSVFESLQSEYKVVIDRLFFIVSKLIRGSAETRENVMQWFARLINVSHLRRGSHADFSKLASNGLMFNISVILIKLSMPFLDHPIFSKIDKIDPNFLGKSKMLNIKDESRVNSSIPEADEYFSKYVEEDTNFISQCFYTTLSSLHFGIGGIYITYDKLKNQIKQLEERIQLLESGGPLPGVNSMMQNMLSSQLPKLRDSLNGYKSHKHVIQAIFGFRSLQLEIFDFIVGASVFITRTIDPRNQFPGEKLSIPIYKISKVSELDDQDFLKTKCPEPWKFFPEYFIEAIINYCKFSTNFRGSPLVRNEEKLTWFIEFAIVLIRCPELLGNPHMKSNIIEILFIGSMPMADNSPGFLFDIFNSNKLVMDNILYSLLDLYVMVEKTGASSQFYDKFNSRYYISVILEELWKTEIYRNQLNTYSVENVDFFVRFFARMLNDTTFLLDETFHELNSINKYQQELKRRQAGEPANEEEFGTTDELTKKLERSEKSASSYMGLSNETMVLFKLFTKSVPKGFMLPELVDRLAAMLDYNLEAMVGPKCSSLKVEDPTKYSFDPKRTLGDLCEIYSNLSREEEFVRAVSKDGRSFKIEWFHKAEKILTSKTFVDKRIIKNLVEFGEKAEIRRKEDEDEEMELGEIPDEYLDPLMFTLMEDPVILPSSKISIDRSTIKAHLLSDGTDPFNRMPLKLEDVVDDVELKQKIEQFKQQSKAK